MKDKNYLKYLQDSPTYYGYGGHKFLLGGFGQKIGNLFNNAVGQMKSTDGNPITSALAEAGIGASSGLGGLGGAINSMIVNPLGKLMNPNGNTTGAGKVMNAVGNVASMIPGVGGVIGASVNQLGNYVNAAFGSNLNDEFIRETKADAQNTRGFSSVAGTNEALAKDFTWLDTVTKDQVGTEGWFSNAATKETQRLNDLIMAANAMKTNQLGARSNVIQENQTRNALMNNFDFGGYLAAEGGGIHIKKKNRGKFTAAAKRAGMGVQEYARHVLANKDRYSSTLVKRANFARNFGGHRKAYGGQEDLLFSETPDQNDLFLYTPTRYELQDNPPKYVRSTFRNDNNVRDALLEELWDIHNNSKDISQRGAGILIQALNKPQGYKGLITRANEIHPIDSLFQVNESQKALEELVKRKIGRHGMNVDMFEPTYLYNDGVVQRMRDVHDAYIDNKASKRLAAALMALNYDETLTNDIDDLYNYAKIQRPTKKGDNRIINYGLFSLENLRPTKEEEKLAGEHKNYVEDDNMWYGQYTKYLKDNKLKDSEKSQAKFYFEKYLPARGYSLEDLNKKEDIAELVRILYKIQRGKYGQKKLQNAIDRANFLYKSTYSEGGKLNDKETMKQQDFEPLNSSYYNPMFGPSSRHKKLRALGGGLDQNNNGVNIVNTGGTHEQNPYEGVQMGIAPDGKPNLVEEDEVIWNDYVFSNRLTIPKEMKEHYKYKHKTFADEAKDAQKESEERPNDPISMNGLEAAMGRLQAVQEFARQKENTKNNGRRFDDGGYTGLINPEIMESSIFRNYLPDFQPLELPEVPDASGAMIRRAPKVDFIEPKDSIDASPLNSTMSYYNTVDPYYEIPNLEEDLELDRLTGNNISGYNTGNNSSNDSDRKGMNLLRLAPVIDSGIQTIVDQFRSPDYSLARDISNARRQIRDVGFTPIGGHMGYTPYDRSYLLNKINQQNAATNRAIVNNSGGNAAAAQAGLIAANYNQTNALGDALMRMDQMNEQRKMEIAHRNMEIDKVNQDMDRLTQGTNRDLDLQRANLAVQAAKAREAIRAREEARRTANRNAFITNLGALGSEMEQRNWLNELIDSGAIRAASGFCKGGKLRKKKGGKHA